MSRDTTRKESGELHLVVAERADNITGVCWTRHPHQHVANLSGVIDLSSVEMRASPHAVAVYEALRKRFASTTEASAESVFWTHSDYDQVIAALDEIDLERGIWTSRDGIKLDDLGTGTVKGFTPCGRIRVSLDRPDNYAAVGAIAPRSCVKPVVRPAA